jgi:hypothetical protein
MLDSCVWRKRISLSALSRRSCSVACCTWHFSVSLHHHHERHGVTAAGYSDTMGTTHALLEAQLVSLHGLLLLMLLAYRISRGLSQHGSNMVRHDKTRHDGQSQHRALPYSRSRHPVHTCNASSRF